MKKSIFIIAELSANHNGNKEIALETVRGAKRVGADAIKLQTYTPDTITLNCDKDDFIINQDSIWDGRKLYDLYGEAYTPWEWHEDIYRLAKSLGLVCFSSPFDKSAVDFLEGLENPIYKIASFEIVDIPLIKYAASKLKPMIISTGIASQEDIELAIETCHSVGNYDITLLKCTSQYPAKPEDANLIMIKDLAYKYNTKVGLSDHTLGIVVPVVSVAMGVEVIEKHFILDKNVGGPDSSFSLDEKEFSEMVKSVREAEMTIGEIDYSLTKNKIKAKGFAKSIYIADDVKKGDLATEKNIRVVRPGYGMHPRYYEEVLGKTFLSDFEKGTALSKEYLK